MLWASGLCLYGLSGQHSGTELRGVYATLLQSPRWRCEGRVCALPLFQPQLFRHLPPRPKAPPHSYKIIH
ncbi:Band 4.1-like protein 3 [Clarias magur]|uniref:Band 4.1-like protein 3 n=1 Tax=Clarias magur TaxID=1594786 RepID=A0A8J4T820_CLAMG|nr:Band 4.1-like protein 3 [Clarias magur]